MSPDYYPSPDKIMLVRKTPGTLSMIELERLKSTIAEFIVNDHVISFIPYEVSQNYDMLCFLNNSLDTDDIPDAPRPEPEQPTET